MHCENLEVGSYFYRAEKNLWKSDDEVSTIGLKWTEDATKFMVDSGWDSEEKPLKVEVALEELPTEATTNEAIGIIATPSDAGSEETSQATSQPTTEVISEVTSQATTDE